MKECHSCSRKERENDGGGGGKGVSDAASEMAKSPIVCNGVIVCVRVCVSMLVTQSCPMLCHPMDCSPPGSSVHGILQTRILE